MIKLAKKKGKPLTMAFLDIKAAYDTVDRNQLWHLTLQKGTSTKLVNAMASLFNEFRSCILVGNTRSPVFNNSAGLLQGSSLSPLLYSFFINSLAGELRDMDPEAMVLTNGLHVNCLLYADDIELFSHKAEILRMLFQVCDQHAVRRNYVFGPSK
jgi:hypothetical protein